MIKDKNRLNHLKGNSNGFKTGLSIDYYYSLVTVCIDFSLWSDVESFRKIDRL